MKHQTVSSPLSLCCSPICLLLALAVVAGCGTREYEKRLENRATKLQKESEYKNLYGALELKGTPVSIRIPQTFKDQPLVEGNPDKDGKPVDPRRIKPGLFEFPWLSLTYEGFVDNPAGGKLAYYCYLGAVDKVAKNIPDPTQAWNVEMSGKGGQVTAWADFQGKAQDGQMISWKKFRYVGDQEFYSLDQGGQGTFAKTPGVLEVYLREDAGQLIVIAWRFPASMEQQVDVAKWAPLVTGCVTVKKPEEKK
jgi:hypothetical protein